MSKLKITHYFIMSFLMLLSTSCQLVPADKAEPTEFEKTMEAIKTERVNTLEMADKLFAQKEYDTALNLYFKIIKAPHEDVDLVYDKALFGLIQLYEKSDQSEKAILALDELIKRDSTLINKINLQVLLIKNHFRVTNYFQAQQAKQELDLEYKTQNINLLQLFNALYYHTDLYYDRHLLDEALFIGEIQKYFIYVIESDHYEESVKLTELLIFYYEKLLQKLDSHILDPNIKKRLAIVLVDQLNRFDRYKLPTTDAQSQMDRFSKFAQSKKLMLTERIADGKF